MVTRNESLARQECVVNLREGEELSYAKIGELCGNISRQAVHQRYKRPSYAYAGYQKSFEIHRRHAALAFLMSKGMTASEATKELNLSRTNAWHVAQKYNLRRAGRRIK